MKIFLSYGDVGDQATGLRLQALGAVHGLNVYVPPAYTRRETADALEAETVARLQEADVVLGVVAAGLTESCRLELNGGMARGKHTVVMAGGEWAPRLSSIAGLTVVTVDPFYPDVAERQVMSYLKGIEVEESNKRNLLAMGTIALGLFLLAGRD
jgi:hypothetical protein